MSPFRGAALRYALAAGGPVATAAAHLLLSLVMLRTLEPAQFGTFAFLLLIAQLSWGIWSALFCAPLPILLHRETDGRPDPALGSMFRANLAAAALAFLLFLAVAFRLHGELVPALLFATFAAIALLRWYARAYAYALETPLRTMISDWTYSTVLIVSTAAIAVTGEAALSLVYLCLAIGALLGLIPFGKAYLVAQFRPRAGALKDYSEVWRRYSGWSLVGVITTEAMANAHAYIVTSLHGPAAFALLASAALLSRPVGVAMNALADFERPRIAPLVARDPRLALPAIRGFRLALIGTWLANAVAACVLLLVMPGLIYPPSYDRTELAIAVALWFLVTLARLTRVPASVLLQAGGRFRPLARTSTVSAIVSVASVGVLIAAFGTLWSILGVLIGESVCALLVVRELRRWKRSWESAAPQPAPSV